MRIEGKTVGILGLSSVLILFITLLVFGFLNSQFSFTDDFISKLGAKGEPNALLFNLFGFITDGILLFAFGLSYGFLLRDKLLSVLLSIFGLGFGFTAIPTDMHLSDSVLSKAHMVSICLGLAFWLFGLARLGYNVNLENKIRDRANFSARVLIISIFGVVIDLWSIPTAHRLVFGIVFGWTTFTSLELINKRMPEKELKGVIQ